MLRGLGDILSELHLLSAALKRWEDEGRKSEDLPLLDWCMADGLATIDRSFAEVFANLPNRFFAGIARFVIQPLGAGRRGPKDRLTMQCAELLLAPSETRDRLTSGLYLGRGEDAVATLEEAFALSVLTERARETMRKAGIDEPETAVANGDITNEEAAQISNYRAVLARVVAVDDFAPAELSLHATPTNEEPRPVRAANA